MNTWFTKLIIQFFFSIDKIVFNLISEIYNLLITIARTSILTQSDIANMADKIYKLLAVFMVFKVTLSLITYIVNPDDFTDKSKGISKLGRNIIISLALLILTPYIFSYAFELQTIILEDNSLAALFFENETDESEESDESNNNASILNTAGDQMAFITMSAFFKPNVSIDAFSECVDLYDENGGINSDCTGVTKNGEGSYSVTGGDGTMAQYFDDDDLLNYVVGLDNQNIGLMFRQKLATATEEINKETVFLMDYKYIFSTVVGIVIILLLLTFCIDVGLRSIKLSFLQLIAPVPILSYIDPKSGKDGMFKKWYQMCFKTYLSLFIRLLAIYFAIYIIGRVGKMVDIVDGSTVTNLWVKIFVIIGALMFAKQFPEILKSLGIKLDGDGKFTLNPLKKFEEGALGGKNITGAARGALVGAAGMFSGAGATRALTGAFRGATSGKGWKETGKAEAEMNRKMRQAALDKSSFGGRMGARLAAMTGFRSESENIAEQKHDLQERIDDLKNQKEAVEARIAPSRTKISNNNDTSGAIDEMHKRAMTKIKQGNGTEGAHYQKMLQDAAQAEAENRGADAERLRQQAETYLNTTGRDLWIDHNLGAGGDEKLNSLYSAYVTKAKTSGHTVAANANGLDKQSKDIFSENTKLQNNIAAEEQQIKDYDDQIKKRNVEMQKINERERRAKADESAIK